MIIRTAGSFKTFGAGGIKLGERRIRLKVKLLIGIAVSTLVAAFVFFVFLFVGNEILDRTVYGFKFMDSMGDKYFNDLQLFVLDEDVSISNLRPLDIWCSRGDRVYLSIYLGDRIVYESVLKSWIKLNPTLYDPSLEDEENRHDLILNDGTVLSAFLYYYSGDAYYYWTIVISGFFSFVAFYICFILFVNYKLKYIEKLKKDLDILAGGDLDYQVGVKGNDELGELANGIEQLRKAVVAHQMAEDKIRMENSELVTALSHDLRTPLTSLLVYLELLDGHKYESQEQAGYFVKRSLEKTYTIKAMADKLFEYLLVYSSGWEPLELTGTDADGFFEQYWKEASFSLKSNGFDVECSFCSLSCRIYLDMPLMIRAFDNICSNIEKYADRAYPVYISYKREGDMVRLYVENRIAASPKGPRSTGIGLNTCRRIIGYHKGMFDFTSKDGSFSVSISLPVCGQLS